MDSKKLQLVIIILLVLVLVRGLIYGLVIPFNQTPDEKYYFELIKAKYIQLYHLSREEAWQVMAQLEVASYYQLRPEASPGKLTVADVADIDIPPAPETQNLYYLAMAWLLRFLSLETIRDEIFAIRSVSILCGMLVVLLSFLVIRELFPENAFLLVGVPTFITFIPQFSAMNVAVNSDKFVEVFAALLFWLLVRIFKRGMNARLLFAYLGMMVLAWVSKRTAVFMVPFLIIALLVYYWKGSLGFRMHLILAAILLTLSYGLFRLLYIEAFYDFFKQHITRIPVEDMREAAYWRNLISLPSLKYYAKFFTLLYWSFWGVFGYMSIHIHHLWYVGAALVQMLSIGGLARFVIQVKLKQRSIERWQVKSLYVFAVSIALMTLAVFMRSVMFQPGSPFLPQGRRLFTVMIPISVLTLFGLHTLVPQKYHRVLAALGIIGLLLLDAVCLSNYILLNFHLLSL